MRCLAGLGYLSTGWYVHDEGCTRVTMSSRLRSQHRETLPLLVLLSYRSP